MIAQHMLFCSGNVGTNITNITICRHFHCLLFAEICWAHHAIHSRLILLSNEHLIRFVSWVTVEMSFLGHNTCAPCFCFLVFFPELSHRTSRTFSTFRTFRTVMQLTSGKTTSPPTANDGRGITVNLPVFTLP